jgi:hypothetical protein
MMGFASNTSAGKSHQYISSHGSIQYAVMIDGCRHRCCVIDLALAKFMHQKPSIVAAYVHACWLKRCKPVVAQVLMPDVTDALQDSDEFLSISSDNWFDCEDDPIESSLSP